MLILISSSKLDYTPSLDQGHRETLELLKDSLLKKEGADVFGRATKIVIVEGDFYHVIKDRYGPILIGEHISQLDDLIDSHLNV